MTKKKVADLKKERQKLIEQKLNYEKELKKLIPPVKNPVLLEFALDRPNEMLFSCPISNRNQIAERLVVDRMKTFSKEKGLIVNFDYPMRMDLQVNVTEVQYKVETVSDPTTGTTVIPIAFNS